MAYFGVFWPISVFRYNAAHCFCYIFVKTCEKKYLWWLLTYGGDDNTWNSVPLFPLSVIREIFISAMSNVWWKQNRAETHFRCTGFFFLQFNGILASKIRRTRNSMWLNVFYSKIKRLKHSLNNPKMPKIKTVKTLKQCCYRRIALSFDKYWMKDLDPGFHDLPRLLYILGPFENLSELHM